MWQTATKLPHRKGFWIGQAAFRRNMEREFYIRAIFPDCNRNRNHDILNPCNTDNTPRKDMATIYNGTKNKKPLYSGMHYHEDRCNQSTSKPSHMHSTLSVHSSFLVVKTQVHMASTVSAHNMTIKLAFQRSKRTFRKRDDSVLRKTIVRSIAWCLSQVSFRWSGN